MNQTLLKVNVDLVADSIEAHIFKPIFCWYENGEYSDFWPSRIQVGMCHYFNPNDERIIEVDIREAVCEADHNFFGTVDKDGNIGNLYKMISQVSLCLGPGKRIISVNVTDMRCVNNRYKIGTNVGSEVLHSALRLLEKFCERYPEVSRWVEKNRNNIGAISLNDGEH